MTGKREELRSVKKAVVTSKKTGKVHARRKHVRRTQVNAPTSDDKRGNRETKMRSATRGLAEKQRIVEPTKYRKELDDLVNALDRAFETGMVPASQKRWHDGYGMPHLISEPDGMEVTFSPGAFLVFSPPELGERNKLALLDATNEITVRSEHFPVPSGWGTVEDWEKLGKKVSASELDNPVVLKEDDLVDGGTKVYHETQIEGYRPREEPEPQGRTPSVAKSIADLESVGVETLHGSFNSFYSPVQDWLVMLPENYHLDSLHYLQIYAHELAHATAHPSRLARTFPEAGESLHPEDHAKEELVAEITAVIVTNKLLERNSEQLHGASNLDQSRIDASANYILGYLGATAGGEEDLQWAVQKAEEAADWILARAVNN